MSPEHSTNEEPVSPQSLSKGYEITDLSLPGIAAIGIALMLILVGILITLSGSYGIRKSTWTGQPVPPVEMTDLENESGRQLQMLRSLEEEKLNTYGWNNQEKKRAHVPIQRAMELLVQHSNKLEKKAK